MFTIKKLSLAMFLLLCFFSSGCITWATPINRYNATQHADAAFAASTTGDWDLARREWAKAVYNADLGNLEPEKRAVFYYEYGRSMGVNCFFDIAEEYLKSL